MDHSEKRERIAGFLNANPVGVLATVDEHHRPHTSVIYFALDDHMNALFTTKTHTNKVANLKHDDHVELVVFDALTQTVCQITGTVWKITDEQETQDAFAATLRGTVQTGEGDVPPISKLVAGPYIAFKIVPSNIRMAVYARPDKGKARDLFEMIEGHELTTT
jgi:general stress protein 26